jgi:hypothetical protein
MIYHHHSSQNIIHCDTGYKFLAILKVKVTAGFVLLFLSLCWIEYVVFVIFINYILPVPVAALSKV